MKLKKLFGLHKDSLILCSFTSSLFHFSGLIIGSMRTSLLLIFLVACSSSSKENEASVAWHGHFLEETSHHPYFKRLTLFKRGEKDGFTEWTYRDMSPGNSQGFCQAIGNCRTLASLYCDYTFKAKNDRIENMEIWGQCPFPKKIMLPR